jgi:diguanylate cyclase (GGDEF)-like protein
MSERGPSGDSASKKGDSDESKTIMVRRTDILKPILAAKDAYLIPITGAGLGERYLLTKMETVIGRQAGVDLRIREGKVSRHHCKIILSEKGPQIVDLDSTNGIFVNHVQVKDKYLQDGDLIRVGETTLKFRYLDRMEAERDEELYRRATRDGLTDLHNRQYFMELLEDELSRSRRHGLFASLIMIDIDGFKAINDLYGHPTGDAVLREMAAALKRSIRREDTLARFGGEEFILLAPQTDGEGAYVLAERLRCLVELRSFAYGGEEFSLTISLGIATFPRDAEGAKELIEKADQALYQAKAAGRNLVCRYGQGWR